MAEHNHTDHDHEHGHDHDHAHDHDGGEVPQFTDPGKQQLAAALRTSFRLLGVIMAVGVVAFLMMGFQSVRTGDVAIRSVFGKVVGTTTEGLAYNWPAPIGKIDNISVGERTVRVEDFWMNETKKDLDKSDLRKREVPPMGLRPGWDGALLTGDRYLLHMRLSCKYTIRRQWNPRTEIDPVLQFRANVVDPNDTVRSVLCDAAIQAAATRTADGLQRSEQRAFERDVQRIAQQELDRMSTGLIISAVNRTQSTWPLATLAAYDAASKAINQAETLKNKAVGEAVSMLNAAAGLKACQTLVGDPREVIEPSAAAGPAGQEGPGTQTGEHNLIGQYYQAVRAGDKAKVQDVLDRIDNELVSADGGEVSRILGEARSDRTATIQEAKTRAKDFSERLPAYLKNPKDVLDRWWAAAREEILDNPTAEKHYITADDSKTILRIGRDPKIEQAIRDQLMKKAKEENR
jgi:regulator of protease activity HflC (stomatin/prohibitin superfamily)